MQIILEIYNVHQHTNTTGKSCSKETHLLCFYVKKCLTPKITFNSYYVLLFFFLICFIP